MRKQAWYVEYLMETGSQPLPFVGRFNASTPPETVAEDIAQSLGLSAHLRNSVATPEAYFSLLAERAEDLGILVMKTGIVKSNTKRPLSVAEFRGFAVIDKMAPLVFINGRDAEVAAVFTLMHELAHVWTGQGGVSDLGFGQAGNKGIEWLCNQTAAELLVPKNEFLPVWKKEGDVSTIARKFRVSRVVIARRALDFGLMDAQDYAAVVAQSRVKSNNERGGGNPYATIPVRNSKRLTTTIVRSALSGEMLLRDAASLLHIKPDTVMELGRRGKSFD
jgi:Zn-dependent peptidase ImmA (M78 family)